YENRLADVGELEHKVKTYEAMLGVKELNKDFVLEGCNIIGADSMDLFSSIILDKGSNSDISVNDPVISGNYVVGIVKKVHPTFCVVETLLNPDTKISAIESKSREIAYVTTNLEFSQKGSCILSGLSRTSSITPGGIIVTSGIGATYPKGLIIGTVSEVNESPFDLSSYAVIQPGVSLSQLEDVFVITEFSGQGVE
ncbi:MAG: rod shape-determining protein MreC, partial [Clostridia bacterium]|nr:rod shape-determining protein MreC [Clostridia bacterium]